MRKLLQALVIAVGASGLALTYNALSAHGIPLETPDLTSREQAVQWSLHLDGMRATLEDTWAHFDRGDAVFIDARSAAAYKAGHIPGALHIPVYQYRKLAPELLGDYPKDKLIIAYCSGGSCQSSTRLAKLLVDDGHTNVKSFYHGWPAWVQAGYPTLSGDAP